LSSKEILAPGMHGKGVELGHGTGLDSVVDPDCGRWFCD
jgi:hypothetical protein